MCACLGLAQAQTQTVPMLAPESITVVANDDYPPYLFRDAKGELQGILKDRWALWQERTGVFVNLQAQHWAQAQRIMQADLADVIDTPFKTAERQQLYDFGQPYARVKVGLFFHHSVSGLVDVNSARGFTVGAMDGDACIDLLQSKGVDSVKRFPSYSDVITAAEVGEVRVFCMDMPSAAYLLNHRNLADSFVFSQPIAEGALHWAVHRGDAALLTLVQAGFDRISEAELQQIDRKWLGASVADVLVSPYARYATDAALVAGAFALLLVAWNVILRQTVRAKTRSLWQSVKVLDQTRLSLERALAEQNAMLDNEMVGIAKVHNRVLVWVNPAIERMLGYGAGEMAGTTMRSYYASEQDYQAFGDKAYGMLLDGKIYRTQTEFVRSDGSRIWVELSGSMLANTQGTSLWIALDITGQRRASAARDEALQRLQKLANSVPGMVYQFIQRPDGSSTVPFVSDAIADIYRVSAQEAQIDASVLFDKHHPADQQQVLDSIEQSALHLTPWQQEYRVRFDDGTVRWLFGNSLPERLADGSVQWHGFITDITERKAADERLRQLSRSVEQAPVSIVITDLSANILYVNPTFSHLTGYSLEEVLGKNPRILQSGQTPPEVFVALWDTLVRGGVWQGELHNRTKSGELFIEHAVIAPVLDAQGQTSHYVAIKDNITQRKQADLALQTSLRDKVALLHEVHHRVKNNLQIITSLLRLEAGRSDEPNTRAVLKDMQGRIYTMALLHESLYRAGTFASVELGAYLRQLATQAFRSQAGVAGDVRLVLALAEVHVGMDQATPCGLLVNELLSNCLKHGFGRGQTGQVTVSLQPADGVGLWCLSVQDTGVGLPPDFEARRALSLGLQLVSDLARQLGGQLTVGSGPGAAFSVVFAVQVFPLSD
ncbi:PAS domain S-box protein [Rhodoferax sp. U11-2br]|uniref:PAS domain S-box protein n=1 Tax=Rhodoferax sp. U11-2br TaxID=2838878 RepID=UPI001BEA8E0E|nr:PAS domain S-box protein [Rhodoferax sp. U11-2br]MBT3065191.1 PAS domain S-box protein [Rhodoferax sp. U11-2br]